MRTYSTWFPTVAARTVGSWICARVIVNVSASDPRWIVSVTLVPSAPWTSVVACSGVMPLISLSPTLTIWSPALSPANAAGEPGTVPVIVGYVVLKLR